LGGLLNAEKIMILIVKLDENMPPLMVEALKHNILAHLGVQSVEWQESRPTPRAADGSACVCYKDVDGYCPIHGIYGEQ